VQQGRDAPDRGVVDEPAIYSEMLQDTSAGKPELRGQVLYGRADVIESD
jgi:hypothetical protein